MHKISKVEEYLEFAYKYLIDRWNKSLSHYY